MSPDTGGGEDLIAHGLMRKERRLFCLYLATLQIGPGQGLSLYSERALSILGWADLPQAPRTRDTEITRR